MPKTAVDEDVYTVAVGERAMVRLHLITDTSVGITIWIDGQVRYLVEGTGRFPLDWYLVKAVSDGRSDPTTAVTATLRETSVRRVMKALTTGDVASFLLGVKQRYGMQLGQGCKALKSFGEAGKLYTDSGAAIYFFHRLSERPKLPLPYFRVL